MSGQATDTGHEAQMTPEVATQIRKIQDRVRQLENQNFALKERLANTEYVTAQKGEELSQRDELLVRLQSELVQDHEELVKEKEEEIRNLRQQITDLKKEALRVPRSKLLSVLWASGREYCCSGCASDAGNDDSHSELKGGQDKSREKKDDEDPMFEYF